MMEKIKNGQTNVLIELLRLFDEVLPSEEEEEVEEMIRSCEYYQLKMLRGHIGKMYSMLRMNLFQLKKDLMTAQQQILNTRTQIGQEVRHYC